MERIKAKFKVLNDVFKSFLPNKTDSTNESVKVVINITLVSFWNSSFQQRNQLVTSWYFFAKSSTNNGSNLISRQSVLLSRFFTWS